MSFKKKDKCGSGNFDTCEDSFIKSDTISQYHDEVTVEDLSHENGNDEGNLIPILDALRSTKAELFKIVCQCYKGYENLEDAPDLYLDCMAHNMGIGREICNFEVTDRETYIKLIKNRIAELGNPFITLGELHDHLTDIFGGGFDLCQDPDGCINILMNRELSKDEKLNMQAYLDSLPIPLDKCVKLYPEDKKKCFYFTHDENNIQHGGWNDSDWNCKESEIYIRNNLTDHQKDFKQCFCWNAPFIPNTPYGFHTECAGWNAGAFWNCGTNADDPIIGAKEFTFKKFVGDSKVLESEPENIENVKSFEWRDEHGKILSHDQNYNYTFEDGSHLIQLSIYDWDGKRTDYKVFHLIGLEPPKIGDAVQEYITAVNKTVEIDPKASDNIKVSLYEWYLDGVLISNEEILHYTPTTTGEKIITLVVYDDDRLTDSKKFKVIVGTKCLTFNEDTKGNWNNSKWCHK